MGSRPRRGGLRRRAAVAQRRSLDHVGGPTPGIRRAPRPPGEPPTAEPPAGTEQCPQARCPAGAFPVAAPVRTGSALGRHWARAVVASLEEAWIPGPWIAGDAESASGTPQDGLALPSHTSLPLCLIGISGPFLEPGQITTRNTSSNDVSPANTFSMPSRRNDVIPSALAASVTSADEARSTASLSIVSPTCITSWSAMRPL